MAEKSLVEATSELLEILEPLDSAMRKRVVLAAYALLGESSPTVATAEEGSSEENESTIGPHAKRWANQNGVSMDSLNEVYHIETGAVEIIAHDVPGSSKRAKTQNCYLLAGVRSLLATDRSDFSDAEAVELCKHVGCYDSPNHSAARKDLGNQLRGSKDTGFSLSVPGLKAAAELLRTMVSK